MGTEQQDIRQDRMKLLYDAIRDSQMTIINIDWKARTLLMVNAITVPLTLGIISFFLAKRQALVTQGMDSPLILLLFVVALFLLVSLTGIFYFTLRVIMPRIRITEKLIYPRDFEKIRDLDIYFPVLKKGVDGFDYSSYREKLLSVESRETIEDILLSELLTISLIREDKHRTLNKATISMGINMALIILGILLLILLLM
jgi:hypothetical protein